MQPPPGLFNNKPQPPPGLVPPPGIQPPGIVGNFNRHFFYSQQQNPTLESLDIDIKAPRKESEVADETTPKVQARWNQMTISTDSDKDYNYLEPRMNNLVVTSEGNIFDVLENDMVAIWDKNFKLLGYHQGLLEHSVAGFQLIPLQGNRLLKVEQSVISILDLNVGTRVDVWDCNNNNMLCADVTNHKPPRIVAVGNGQFCVWVLNGSPVEDYPFETNATAFDNKEPVKSTKHMDLLRIAKTRFVYCDSLVALDNGVVLAKHSQEGEVFIVDMEAEEVQELASTQGSNIQDWSKLRFNQIALGENGNIFVVEFKGKRDQLLLVLKTPNDICQMQGLLHDKLATVSTRGEVRIWDRNNGKLLKYFFHEIVKNKSHFNMVVVDSSTLMTYSNDEKCLSILNITYMPQIALTNTVNFKARLRNVNLCRISPCMRYVFLVQESGTFTGGQVDFTPEIELYFTNDSPQNSLLRKKTIREGALGCVCFSTGSVEKQAPPEEDQSEPLILTNQPCIQFVITPRKTVSSPTLMQWFFTHDITLATELAVERFSDCQLYCFNRMVFSYSYEKAVDSGPQKSNETFNMFAPTPLKAPSSMALQKFSGLSAYDVEQHLLLKVVFEQAFLCTAFDMPNEMYLYFLNQRQQIEVWNVITQLLVQKADVRPSIIRQIKFQELPPHLVFLNGTGELIVRNHKLGLINKKKTDTKVLYKRSEFIDEQRLVLLHKRTLEIWNFIENRIDRVNVDFDLNDFIILPQAKIIFIIGDYCMKQIKIK